MTERKRYEEGYRLGETLFSLHFNGGECFLDLTEDEVREKLQVLDSERKLIKGKDYTIEPINK